MAKQQGSGVVAAARRVSDTQGKFQDVGGQFMTGYNKSLETKKKKEAENKETQARVNNLMGQFKNDIDVLKFKPEDQTLVKNTITQWRNGYAEAANAASKIQDKSSAAYQEQVDIMNDYKNRMVNLKGNLDNLAAFKGEYKNNIDAGHYSNAGANSMSLAQGETMVTNPIGSINDSGDLVWGPGTGSVREGFSFQDYQMPFEKATGLATALGDIAGDIRKQTTPLDDLQKREIEEKVDSLISNPKALASLISDSDLPAFDFSNIDPDDPNAKEEVRNLLISSIYKLQGSGVVKPKTPATVDKSVGIRPEFEMSYNQMLDLEDKILNSPIGPGGRLDISVANANKVWSVGPKDKPSQIRVKIDPKTKKWVYFDASSNVRAEYNSIEDLTSAYPTLFFK